MTASLLAPVIASFLCWRAGASVADGVGTGAGVVVGFGVADGVGVGTGVADGVVDGLGVGVTDGLGADGLGLGDTDGAGVGVTGVGVVLGVGAGVVADGLGLGSGVGAGLGVGVGVGTTGLVSNPALPPASRRTIRAVTSQDWSWETILAVSVHGPGSAGSTPTFSWSRAFSP